MLSYPRFLKSFSIFCVIIAVPVFTVYYAVKSPYISRFIPLQFAFFVFLTLFIHYFFIRAIQKSPRQFLTYFMGLTALKMFIYLVFLMVFFLVNKAESLSFTLSFMVFYICFTSYEVGALLKANKAVEKTGQF